MARQFSELPGWWFDADEVSAGVYRAVGRDLAGRNVEACGIDPEALIQQCRAAAVDIMAKSRKKDDSSQM